MNSLNLKRTNVNSLLVKQLHSFLSTVAKNQETKNVLVIGFNVSKDTPTKTIVKQLVKHYHKKGLKLPDIVIGDCSSSVTHKIAHSAVEWGLHNIGSTQQFVEQSGKSGKIIGLYGDWFSKEASYYWKSYDLVISVRRVEKLQRAERLYEGPYPLEFQSSERLAEAVRKSYFFLDRFMTNLMSIISPNNGHFFLMLEIFDPDNINFLIYRLVNDAFFKAASSMELSHDVIHNIISPFMVFRSLRLVEKLTKYFHQLDKIEVELKFSEVPCMCTTNSVGNLDKLEERQHYVNELIGSHFTWVEEEVKECTVLTAAQKVNLVVETRSALRNSIMDILSSGSDFNFNTIRQFLIVRGKHTPKQEAQTIAKDDV